MSEVTETLLGKRTIGLLIVTIISFILGGALMIKYQYQSLLVFPNALPLVIITSTVFGFGFLFFGYLTPLPMFFVGSYISNLLMENGVLITDLNAIPTQAFVLFLSSLMVAYSSIVLGDSLLKDMAGRGNFLKVLEISISLLVVGIAIAVSGDLLL